MHSNLHGRAAIAVSEENLQTPRFLVIQNGARHDYAVPMALHRAGALAALFTDLTSTNGIGPALSRLPRRLNPFAAQLGRRTPPPEVAALTQTTGASFVLAQAFAKSRGRDLVLRLSQQLFERTLLRRGTQGATHVYTMNGEGGQLIQHARNQGLGVVVDIFIAPSADAIVAHEYSLFPDWSDGSEVASPSPLLAQRGALHLGSKDLLLCPSDYVRDDVLTTYGADPARAFVVPYAVNTRWLTLESTPEPGRILFAGSASLRKGIHHLAAAATLLRGAARIRVAGNALDTVRKHPDARDLVFLGHLNMIGMADEFARADVLAFPSLSEGSASVTAEALGAGVPVVTTKSAGSIVRHGIDGLIVPERDPEALAEAILSIVRNREMRENMSRSARARALEFTWDGFAQEVIRVTMAEGEARCRLRRQL